MTFPARLTTLGVLTTLLANASTPADAQDPPGAEPKEVGPAKPERPVKPAKVDGPARPDLDIEVKPLPPVAIPDDPPPHEGAFFDLPLTIEPPDIIVVEVLEALPGRPITGQRLVRPDGTISLGFYGDVHVRGLTVEQAKVKIILHMRRYLIDEVLGLVTEVVNPFEEEMPSKQVIPLPDDGRSPFDLERPALPSPKVEPPPADEAKPVPGAKPEGPKPGRLSAHRPGRRVDDRTTRRARLVAGQDHPRTAPSEIPRGESPRDPAKPPRDQEAVPPPEGQGLLAPVAPADSQRVFVDIDHYNAKVYYVQGDVAKPGRIAWTGSETVLDALNYAGGFVPTAEPTDIHLHRPARGGKPAKDYKIDLDAIHKGVATANLQLFPNDRLVVGRNPIVAKTIEVDRAVGLFNSLSNSIMNYAFSKRTLAVMDSPNPGKPNEVHLTIDGKKVTADVADPAVMTPARREALFKEWAEFFWSVAGSDAMNDEKAFKDALMKKLTPAPEPK